VNIAVTGGIGSGKSTVAQTLTKEIGAMSASADILCRELLKVGNGGYLQLKKQFPAEFFLSDGSINRPLLRKEIFSNSAQRAVLDGILHPLVRLELRNQAITAASKALDFVAEVPLLYEKGWQDDFDCTLVVFAENDLCVSRVVERDFVSKEDAIEAISTQMSLLEKCEYGDWVIDNSKTFDITFVRLGDFIVELSKNSLFHGKLQER